MNDEKIHTVDEYIERSKDLIYTGGSTYRGQCCSSWSLEPGIVRRVKKTYTGIGQGGLLFSCSRDITIQLLKTARTNGYFKETECDLNILAVLQHYGAATPLLDFTYDPLVALYFACQPYTENGIESDGKIFCINYPDQIKSYNFPMRPVKDPSCIKIESALEPASHRGIWYWKAPGNLLCERSEKQMSVFVFGWGLYWENNIDRLVEELHVLTVCADSKRDILTVLKEKYDISEQTLFPDIHGFAQSNRCDKLIQHFSAEEFYDKGEEQWRDGNPECAAEYYKMAYTKKFDWIEARCKCALALNCNGEQSEALDVIEESIKKLGENWKLLVCKAIINEILGKDWKADLEKAENMANEINESGEFKTFIDKYGDNIDPSSFGK